MTDTARTLEILEMLLQQGEVRIIAAGPYAVYAGYGFQRIEGDTLHDALEAAARQLKVGVE